MAVDLTKPLWIVAQLQNGRLAVIGGSNDQAEARLLASMSGSLVLLRAELAPEPGRLNDDGSTSYVLPS